MSGSNERASLDALAAARPPMRLAHARVPTSLLAAPIGPRDGEGAHLVDLWIDADGRVADVRSANEAAEGATEDAVDLAGRHLWPLLVEPHAHLDKAHTVERAPNRTGGSRGARDAAKDDRKRFDAGEVAHRMTFALETAEAHGVGALRSHIDSQPGRMEPAWSAFHALRDAWESRIQLRGVATLGAAKLWGGHGETVARACADAGAALGPVIYAETDGFAAHLDRAFDLAERFGLDLDFHVDETLAPSARGVEAIARRVLDRRFAGHVVCGHGCSLSVLAEADADRAMRLMAEAGIGLVVSPATNLLLQDRTPGRTPRLRGLAPIQELCAAGASVAVGGDNCRDAFHPFGDHDPLDAFRDAVRLAHLDGDLGGWADLIGPRAREVLGLDPARIGRGAPADFILFEARSFSELLARPHAPRRLIRSGRAVAAAAPSYARLDERRLHR